MLSFSISDSYAHERAGCSPPLSTRPYIHVSSADLMRARAHPPSRTRSSNQTPNSHAQSHLSLHYVCTPRPLSPPHDSRLSYPQRRLRSSRSAGLAGFAWSPRTITLALLDHVHPFANVRDQASHHARGDRTVFGCEGTRCVASGQSLTRARGKVERLSSPRRLFPWPVRLACVELCSLLRRGRTPIPESAGD